MNQNSIMSPNDSVLVELRDAVVWITINRPNALNAINHDMVAALNMVTVAIHDNTTIRAVVLGGNGEHFMAGGDIKCFKQMLDKELDKTILNDEFEGLLTEGHEVILNMIRMPQPIVAAVHGAVAGAGVSFVLACDLVIAAENSYFNLVYCHLGVSSDGGSTYALPSIAGMKRAFEIALLGGRFDAATAEKWELINRVVPSADMKTAVDDLAARLAQGPTRAHAHAKALLNALFKHSLVEQLNAETASFTDCTTTNDFDEGVNASLKKRKPEFKGC